MVDFKEVISGFLRENPRGLSIGELSSKAGIGRQQVKVILSELKGEGKITVRPIGRVKLHYWKKQEINYV